MNGAVNSTETCLWLKYTLLTTLLLMVSATFWLADAGQLAQLDEWLLGGVFSANEAFLEEAAQRAQSMTLMLTELHAGLLVLQSSEFGISFFVDANIQLGNAVAQLTEMVAYGRNFALFNLVALHIIENLLELIQWLTPWLILVAEVALVSIVMADTWVSTRSRWHMSLIRFGEGALIVALLLVVIFPLSVNGVRQSSEAITKALYHNSYEAISDTREHILPEKAAASIKSDASASLAQFKSSRVKLSEKSSYLATHLTRYVAVTLLEVFLLPLMFSLLMFWIFQSLIRRHRHWSL